MPRAGVGGGESKGAGFEVEVTCEPNKDNVDAQVNGDGHSETLTFGPNGGTEEAKAPPNSTCTIVETQDGGASKVVVSPDTCEFTNEEIEAKTEPPPGGTCEVTVTNTFEKPPAPQAGPAGPSGPPGEAAAATAVVTVARFTG